ncbi:MAG: hypothetical protein ACI917_001840, partial [Patiriisocius sp.]
MKNFFLLAVLIGLFVNTMQSQVTDLARLEFTYFP